MSRKHTRTRRHAGSVRTAVRTASGILTGSLPSWALYHSPDHTRQVVRACRTIGRALRLPAEQMEILHLAAWFHDTGYVYVVRGHEERSVVIAREALAASGFGRRTVAQVCACIRATRMPQRPRSVPERVICDADMVSLGRRSFFRWNELLRREVEKRGGRRIPRAAWLRRSHLFLNRHRFTTGYGRTVLERGRRGNLDRVRRLIRESGNPQGRRS